MSGLIPLSGIDPKASDARSVPKSGHQLTFDHLIGSLAAHLPAPVQSVENSELHEFSNGASRSGHQAVMQSARLTPQFFVPQ
jgi:hypothetical protein